MRDAHPSLAPPGAKSIGGVPVAYNLSVNAFAMIFVWMAAGFFLRRARVPARAFVELNRFIVWVPLSAVILRSIHALAWDPSYWVPVSMAWLVFAGSAALFAGLGLRLGWGPRTTGVLVLTAGLGNTSFIGYPLLRALYGERVIPVAVLTDQPGSFLALATAGIVAASYYSAGRASGRVILGRLARFPPVWALLTAALLRGVEFPPLVATVLGWAGSILVPLALLSVGAQLRFDPALVRRERVALAWGLGYKLVLAPLAIAVLFAGVLGHRGETVRVTILEAAMGPMITAGIVADEHGLDPELSALMVGLGAPACLITVPLWAKLLEWCGS